MLCRQRLDQGPGSPMRQRMLVGGWCVRFTFNGITRNVQGAYDLVGCDELSDTERSRSEAGWGSLAEQASSAPVFCIWMLGADTLTAINKHQPTITIACDSSTHILLSPLSYQAAKTDVKLFRIGSQVKQWSSKEGMPGLPLPS
jgi:hypothetical protein